MAKRAKRMRAYRLPDETIFEIERLAEEWQCTQAEVLERILASRNVKNAYRADLPTDPWMQPKELKVEYDIE